MNKKNGILSLFLSVLFAACSSDEPTINEGGETNGKDLGYIAVNIVQPKSTGTRTAPNGFEYGTTDENTAREALFFIFSEDGKTKYGNAQRVAIDGSGAKDEHAVERVYNAVLVIDTEEDPTLAAKQLICILNAPVGLENDITMLSQLTTKIDDYGTFTSGAFIMSNSVYMDGETKKLGAVISSDKIKKSASAAKADPVDIYVERIVAKVRAHGAKDGSDADAFENTGAHPIVDGVQKTLTIVPTGIEIANIAEKSKLLKNLDNITWPTDVSFSDNSNWNSTTYFRSYWEVTPSDCGYTNHSYNQIVGGATNFQIKDVKLEQYVQPNTNQGQKTSILVTAELMDGENLANLAYIRGGYTTEGGALALVAQFIANQGYVKKTSAENVTPVVYSNLDINDFGDWINKNDDASLIDLKSYEVIAQVKSNISNIYKRTVDNDGKVTYTSSTAAAVNEFLKSEGGLKYKARVYKDGKCYYFVNIDQSSVVGLSAGELEGVVRNHIYDLTLNSIGGIGVPVYDPTDEIIPETPGSEDLFFLAARINVLDWKLVTQEVSFGENDTPTNN